MPDREYIDFLETVLDHPSEAIYVGNCGGNILFINKEAERIDHIAKNRVVDCNEEEIFDTNVMICVEADTGKDMFTQGIHDNSNHQKEPFGGIHYGAVPKNLTGAISPPRANAWTSIGKGLAQNSFFL